MSASPKQKPAPQQYASQSHRTALIGSMITLVVACLIGLWTWTSNAQTWPSVIHPWNITGTTIEDLEIVDSKRIDPYFGGQRKLMVSIFTPFRDEGCKPYNKTYLPSFTAAHLQPLLEGLGIHNMTRKLIDRNIRACKMPHGRVDPDTGLMDPTFDLSLVASPIVLFSHGLNSSRLLSSYQAQRLSMHGYIVITIDHPGSARVVTWPNGTTSLSANISTNAQVDADVRLRAKDIAFVLDQFHDYDSVLYGHICWRFHDRQGHLEGNSDYRTQAMFGHSLGGATGVYSDFEDGELRGVVNLDGYPYGFNTTGKTLPNEPVFHLPEWPEHSIPNPNDTSQGPIMLLNEPDHVNATAFTNLYDNLSEGRRFQLELLNSAHWTFTDLPFLVDGEGMRDKLSPEALKSIGSISGERSQAAIDHLLAAFFDNVMKDVPMIEPDNKYPEIRPARPKKWNGLW